MDKPHPRDLATTVLWLSPHRSVSGCSLSQAQGCSWLKPDLPTQFSCGHGAPSLSAVSLPPRALAQMVSVVHATSLAHHVLFKNCVVSSRTARWNRSSRESQGSCPTHNCSVGSLDGSNGLMSGNWRNSRDVVWPRLSLTARVKTSSACS